MAILHERDRRGGGRMGWLETAHTFSFGNFMDPNRMGFRALRVLNEDRVIPGAGFPSHSHADMDIVTYVISGALKHEDSLGTGSVIRPGEIQRMSAGPGITHSEMNASDREPVHFLQVWIIPDAQEGTPSYQQEKIDRDRATREFVQIAGCKPFPGSVRLFSDTTLKLRLLEQGQTKSYVVEGGRGVFVQAVDGKLLVNGETVSAGDGIQIDGPADLQFAARAKSEILVFDLS